MTILAFPVDREINRVRSVASQLARRHGRLADKYWRTECNQLVGRMQVQGLSRAQIKAEIDRFSDAVFAEMQARTNPKGAA